MMLCLLICLAPKPVSGLNCSDTGSPNTLEVVWSPPTGQAVLSYLVQVSRYEEQGGQVVTTLVQDDEILPENITVPGLG